ncbi:caspase family protein [Streptomyces sp. NPDC056503]|uniref:wHTH domain-containing protein n=1 Tax=Streptomyces sp. NPDC056503 TaxID=3345842 RepID=UPI0036744A00
MARYKALLIGASEYDDEGIPSLPFVRDDLQRLSQALSARDFQPVKIVESPRGITPNVVNGNVRRFLQEAKRGDSLFVLISGHGLHFEGRDYLIPEDASHEIEPFADACVEIGWQKDLENCAAEHVVFLVDACREGVERDIKAPPRKIGWEPRKIEAALRRKVAYVYACSTGQYARFVREKDEVAPGSDVDTQPGDSFSLFSRAVSDVVAETAHRLDIAGFADAVQERVSALHAAYGKKGRVQQVRVDTDVPHREFSVLPGPPRSASVHPWVQAAEHLVWDLVDPSPARDALRRTCVTMAARLSEAYEDAAHALRDDPWHDRELARRTLERLAFLAKLGKGTALSPSEAALLVLLPLVSQAFWSHEAARRTHVLEPEASGSTASPEQQRFRKFVRGFPRLKRRLRTLDQRGTADGSVERIRWWLYHRWLTRQPELYTSETLKELLGPLPKDAECPAWVPATLSDSRFLDLLRDMRAAPFTVAAQGGDAREFVAAATRDEHLIRGDLVEALAKAAQAFAVDPLELPEIVVEHLGISDSVDLAGLLTAVRGSDWRQSGTGRSLHAVCDHPAVQIALREHARHADALLRAVNRSEHLTALRALPPYADADLVRLSGATAARMADGIRFQLAEDRVQELLMGEGLYGERDLAIRELYQNALDAVRYRDRRVEYLRRRGHPVAPWEGLIEFVQGIDEQERPYLECRDNGVGMGIDELGKVFSQGGTRFVDLPEYIEEQSAWTELGEPKIELFPNSRFGIGVLSYFMLADEIEVRTCRMGLDGRPGRLLRVRIAGPGNLFRIDDLGEGTEPGTTVRLLLADHQERVSCVEALQEVLWLAPYRTTAEHGFRNHEWLPDELSADGHEAQLRKRGNRNQGPFSFHPSELPEVWWTDGLGWLLADGLYAEGPESEQPYGTVVNLVGPHQPELSIDRNHLRKVDVDHVKNLVHQAIPSLFTTARGVLTPLWLAHLAAYSVILADDIVERAAEAEFPWPVGTAERPIGDVGVFTPDAVLLPLVDGDYGEDPSVHLATLLRSTPEQVLGWRLHTLYAAGLGDPLAPAPAPLHDRPTARPSDLALLLSQPYAAHQWAREADNWLSGPESGTALYAVPSLSYRNTGLASLAVLPRWRDPRKPVSPDVLFEIMNVTGYPAAHLAERMRELGFTVAPLYGAEAAKPADLPLLRERWGDDFCRKPGTALPLPQIFLSAAYAEVSPRQAAKRLGELGFTVPHDVPDGPLSSEEKAVLREYVRDTTADAHARESADISVTAIVTAACGTGVTPREAAAVFARAGFTLPCEDEALPGLTDADEALVSHGSALLSPYLPVPRVHLWFAADRTGRTAEEVASRLSELGFTVPELDGGPPPFTRQDFAFLGSTFYTSRNARWPQDGAHLDASEMSALAHRWDFPMKQTRERLTGLGYDCARNLAFDDFTKRDLEIAYFCFAGEPTESVGPALLDAVAEHVGRPAEDVAEHVTGFGFTVEPPTPEHLAERTAEKVLLADLGDGKKPDDEPPGSVGLPVLAAVAARLRLPFRTVADRATALGMRHEAADWFASA